MSGTFTWRIGGYVYGRRYRNKAQRDAFLEAWRRQKP